MSRGIRGIYNDYMAKPHVHMYGNTFTAPEGVRYGVAPWYMQYIDTAYGKKREKKRANTGTLIAGIGLVGFGLYYLYKKMNPQKNTSTIADDSMYYSGGVPGFEDSMLSNPTDIITTPNGSFSEVQVVKPYVDPLIEDTNTGSALDAYGFNSLGIADAPPMSDGTPRYYYQAPDGTVGVSTDKADAYFKAGNTKPFVSETTQTVVTGNTDLSKVTVINSGGSGSAVTTQKEAVSSKPIGSSGGGSGSGKISGTVTIPSTGKTITIQTPSNSGKYYDPALGEYTSSKPRH